MILIYIALFMTVILSFWGLQVFDYNRGIDRTVASNFAKQIRVEHEYSVDTVRDLGLYDFSGAGAPNVSSLLGKSYASDELLYPLPAGSDFKSRCFDISTGSVESCYEGSSSVYKLGHPNTYQLKTQIVANVGDALTPSTVQAVSYVKSTNSNRINQRDIYRSFVGNSGYNMNMGLLDIDATRKTDSSGTEDFVLRTGVSDSLATVSGSLTDLLNDECFYLDRYGECFVMVTDLGPIATADVNNVVVDISDIDQDFWYKSNRYMGIMAVEEEEAVTFTLDGTKNVNLYITVSGYSSSGDEVPALYAGTNSYNQHMLDVDDFTFEAKQLDGSWLEVNNDNDAYTTQMRLKVRPNESQFGGAYVTVTAVYEGSNVDLSNSILQDSMTFLVYDNGDAFLCDPDGDGKILSDYNEDEPWYPVGGYYEIGNPLDLDDVRYGAKQLLCLSQNQQGDGNIVRSNYRMIADAEFNIDFDVKRKYMNESGDGEEAEKDIDYKFLKSISVNVKSNREDWDGDGLIDGSSTTGWVPIGGRYVSMYSTPPGPTKNNRYQGTFDGAGHKITNLYSNGVDFGALDWASNLGFIGEGGTLKGLELKGIYLSSSTAGNVGGAAGLFTSLEDVTVQGDIVWTNEVSGSTIGGLTGTLSFSSINDLYSDVNIYNMAPGGSIGGLMGRYNASDSTISGCYSIGDIYSKGGSVGGFWGGNIGHIIVDDSFTSGTLYSNVASLGGFGGTIYYKATVTNSHSARDITSEVAGASIGGFFGGVKSATGRYSTSVIIRNSRASGKIIGQGNLGGFAGSVYKQGYGSVKLTIDNSISDVTIIGKGNVGGMVGAGTTTNGAHINIVNSISYANIIGGGNVGGLVGAAAPYGNGQPSRFNITDSYAEGNITVSISDDTTVNNVGGLLGKSQSYYDEIRSSYANVNIVTTVEDPSVNKFVEINAGGLIGLTTYINFSNAYRIINSYATGSMNIEGYKMYVGGLIGKSTSNIIDSYSDVDMNINVIYGGFPVIGGLVGGFDSDASSSKIQSSYALGSFNINGAITALYLGGLVGKVIMLESKYETGYSGVNIISDCFAGGYIANINVSYNNTLTEFMEIDTSDIDQQIADLEALIVKYEGWLSDWPNSWIEDEGWKDLGGPFYTDLDWPGGPWLGVWPPEWIIPATTYTSEEWDQWIIDMLAVVDDILNGPYGGLKKRLDDLEDVKADFLEDMGIGAQIGGLIGSLSYGQVSNSSSSMEIPGTDRVIMPIEISRNDGGLIGAATRGPNTSLHFIDNCYATGDVESRSGNSSGGLVGLAQDYEIRKSYASGRIIGFSNAGGLVGYAFEGANLEDSFSSNASVFGKNYVGGLVGKNYKAAITNSYSSSNLISYGNYGGGLTGYSYDSDISNSYATGNIMSPGNYIGGLIGNINLGSLDKCFSSGTVTVLNSGSRSIGGLVGQLSSSISNCYSSSTVNSSGNYVGGLVGWAIRSSGDPYTISYCSASGDVKGNSYVGGFIGEALGAIEIENSSAHGTVEATGNQVGGFVGITGMSGWFSWSVKEKMENCYATGDVISSRENRNRIAGFAGQNHSGDIINAYATGSVSVLAGSTLYRGFVGNAHSPSNIDHSYALNDVLTAGGTASDQCCSDSAEAGCDPDIINDNWSSTDWNGHNIVGEKAPGLLYMPIEDDVKSTWDSVIWENINTISPGLLDIVHKSDILNSWLDPWVLPIVDEPDLDIVWDPLIWEDRIDDRKYLIDIPLSVDDITALWT